MALRLFIVAALLLGVAYWYVTKGETEKPMETERKAMEQAEQVEGQVLKQAEDLEKKLQQY